MPDVLASNNWLGGIAKQTNEATVPATAVYSYPAADADPVGPRWDPRRIDLTDANAIEGDISKGPSRVEGSTTTLGWDNQLGTVLVGLWPTDTATGTAPARSHAFSGLGSSQPWIAMYQMWPAVPEEFTFGKGHVTGVTFGFGADSDPMTVQWNYLGQEASKATTSAFPATTAVSLADGFFTLHHATGAINADIDTPNSVPATPITNVVSGQIVVNRNAAGVAVATGTTVTNLSVGKVSFEGSTLTMLFDSFASYATTFFGSAAGNGPLSGTLVAGALQLVFKHSVSTNSQFQLYIPSVIFRVPTGPKPDPSGDALQYTVELMVQKPTSGDHVQPTLINNVTPAY